MKPLTPQGLQRIQELASQYYVSSEAVLSLLEALVHGNGTMAQFSHPDLGGSGQWMMGGMTMVGDMFNHSLKAKVDGLCFELSNLLNSQPFQPTPISSQSQYQGNSPISLFVPGSQSNWWPESLGVPSSTGAQNHVKYAYFPSSRRLAIYLNGELSIYDTLQHSIGGVSQQQSQNGSLLFTSQFGTVDVASLPKITDPPQEIFIQTPPISTPTYQEPSPLTAPSLEDDIFLKIEKLAELKAKGILTDEEFTLKKKDLLSRL